MLLRKYVPLLILIALTAAMNGCTKEDTTDCFSGLKLKFRFTLHNNGGNKFGDEVNRIYVYLFDEQGILQLKAMDDTQTLTYSYLLRDQLKTMTGTNLLGALPNDYVMHLDIPPGKYKIIVWGSSAQDTESVFLDAYMNTTTIHDHHQEGVVLGVTRMEDFLMFMRHNHLTDLPENIAPIFPEIDDFWYGVYGTRNETTSKYTMDETVVKSGEITEADIELIRNTNIVKVTVTGFENIAMAGNKAALPFRVCVTAANGCYKFDNSIEEKAQPIRYIPYLEQMAEGEMQAYIKIVRMDIENHTIQPVYLIIEDSITRQRLPMQPIDIMNVLMQAKDAGGNYIYRNQADFDREYEHPIEIRIGLDMQVRIFIRGWEIVMVIPEI